MTEERNKEDINEMREISTAINDIFLRIKRVHHINGDNLSDIAFHIRALQNIVGEQLNFLDQWIKEDSESFYICKP